MKIIVISAMIDDHIREEALAAGAAGFFDKSAANELWSPLKWIRTDPKSGCMVECRALTRQRHPLEPLRYSVQRLQTFEVVDQAAFQKLFPKGAAVRKIAEDMQFITERLSSSNAAATGAFGSG